LCTHEANDVWIASYPFEKAVKNPGLDLWIGCAPVTRGSRTALGSARGRGETIQPRVHFLIASRYRECRYVPGTMARAQ
jgi:hypothetical protein